jgi:hypothetical protein
MCIVILSGKESRSANSTFKIGLPVFLGVLVVQGFAGKYQEAL